MTLRDVGIRSAGRFKPTAVAGYERGDRSISLARFLGLSRLYEMAPERLLLQILWTMAGRPEPTIDLRQMTDLPADERSSVDTFIRQVQTMRDAGEGETITLRINDLEVLATMNGSRIDEFLEQLDPVLVQEDVPR